jgi:diguanylate cyclase (GGDEF)-like protein
VGDNRDHLAGVRELERVEFLRTERRHLWVRLGVALTALIITLSLKVAVPVVAVLSTVLLVAFPIVARWLGRDASRARLRAITRTAVGFYVATGALWVLLLAPNADDLTLAIAAPTLAAAATIGLRVALGATALFLAADVLATYLRAAVYGHSYEAAAIALQLVGLVGIGVISGLGTDALRTARRTGRRQRRAQALLTSFAPEIAGTLDAEEALRRVVGAAVELSDAHGGVIAARDPQTGRYRIRGLVNAPESLAGREMPPGQGLTALVLERGGTVVAAGAELLAILPDFSRGMGWASAMATPVRIGEEVVAVPVVWTRDPARRFDSIDQSGLESLATLAATALANARLYAGVELQRRRLRLLYEMRAIVGSSLELETILERALEQLEDVFGMARTFVLLPDDDARGLRVRAHRGAVRKDVADLVIAIDQGLSGAAFRDRRIVNVTDVTKDDRYVLTAPDVRSEIALPLVTGETTVGVLLVSSASVAAFGPDDEQVLTLFADELSAAIANARAYDAQREAALRDDRTGLYNHRYFREALERELARAERHGAALSLLFIDLDDLKGINDRYGHEAGDAVIQRVAKLMTRDRRRTDVAARIGGEEFALLLPETPQADALAIAERLRADAALDAIDVSGERIAFTISVGVATFPDSARDASSLRREADMALYAAKRAGRDRVAAAPRRSRG